MACTCGMLANQWVAPLPAKFQVMNLRSGRRKVARRGSAVSQHTIRRSGYPIRREAGRKLAAISITVGV